MLTAEDFDQVRATVACPTCGVQQEERCLTGRGREIFAVVHPSRLVEFRKFYSALKEHPMLSTIQQEQAEQTRTTLANLILSIRIQYLSTAGIAPMPEHEYIAQQIMAAGTWTPKEQN